MTERRVIPLGERIYWAVSERKLAKIDKLLCRADARDVNWRDSDYGQSPLEKASYVGYEDVVALLLLHSEIDVNREAKNGETPLTVACQKDHVGVMELLLKHPKIEVNKANSTGNTPLSICCYRRCFLAVKALLAHPLIDVNKPRTGDNPLNIACKRNQVEIVKILLQHPIINVNQPDSSGYLPLATACHRGNREIIQLLLLHPIIDVNKGDRRGNTPLINCCLQPNQIENIKLLLSNSLINSNKPNGFGESPLYIACQTGNREAVKLLLSLPNIEVNRPTKKTMITPLEIAYRQGHLDIVECLLNHPEMVIPPDSGIPFFLTCIRGDLAQLEAHLHDQRSNLADSTGKTGLYLAVENRQVEAVKLLMDPKWNVRVNDGASDGTPLYIACQKGYTEIVELLLQNPGIFVNLRSSMATPLYAAIAEKHLDIAELILASGKNVNLKMGMVLYVHEFENSFSEITVMEKALELGLTDFTSLLEAYQKDPAPIIARLREKHGPSSKLFAMIILLSDDYVQIKSGLTSKITQFFQIAKRLPMELQMKAANQYSNVKKPFVLSSDFEYACRYVLRYLL